jgi:hypothetical protein
MVSFLGTIFMFIFQLAFLFANFLAQIAEEIPRFFCVD